MVRKSSDSSGASHSASLPTETSFTETYLDALADCITHATPPRSALAALAHFQEGPVDFSAIDLDELRAFVKDHYPAIARLCTQKNHAVRYAALLALGGADDRRAATVIVAALRNPRSPYDHDFAYMAAGQLRARGVAWFTDIALDGPPEDRAAALSCIGLARSPDVAIAALDRVAQRHGSSVALFSALFNVHDVRALPLAIAGLDDESPEVRMNAVGVVHQCVRIARETGAKLSVAHKSIARSVERLLIDPRMWIEPADPWASAFAWTLGILADCEPPVAERVARSALASKVRPERQREAFSLLRSLPYSPAIEGAVLPLTKGAGRENALLAATVLSKSPDEKTRRKALETLHDKVLAGGGVDALWHDVVDALGQDPGAIDHWLAQAARERKKPRSALRDRVARAIEHLAFDHDDAWTEALLARCDERLAAAVRKLVQD